MHFLFLFLAWDGALKGDEVFKLCQKNSSASLGPEINFLKLCILLPLFKAKEKKTE